MGGVFVMPVHWIKHCTSFNYGNPITNGRNALVLTAVDLGWGPSSNPLNVILIVQPMGLLSSERGSEVVILELFPKGEGTVIEIWSQTPPCISYLRVRILARWRHPIPNLPKRYGQLE